MPRMHLYLPDELYRAVKEQGLSASELLQRGIRAELHRRSLLAESERYVDRLIRRVGRPTSRERAAAESLAKRITARAKRTAG